MNRLNLNQPNEIELILMKNIREELADIPVEYISTITYDMTTYMKMELQIPNQLKRGGKIVPFPLFDQIKGKQQLILKINGQLNKLIIDDKIDVIETSTGKTKKVYAYGYERVLEKKTFLLGTAITRQLYRRPDEEVEISDGILNLLEQQTNWKVGYVDEMACKEPHQYHETISEIFCENFTKDNVVTNEILWSHSLETPINKDQTFTIYHHDLSATRETITRDKQTFSHTFTPVKAVQHIATKYSSDDTYRFGLTYILTYTDGTTDEFKTPFTNVKGFSIEVGQIECAVQTGEFVEKLVTRYRYFEQTSTNWYPFLSDVAEAFDCVFVFDNYNQVINCYHKDNFGSDHGLFMSYENTIKQINKTHNIGEIVTRLFVQSPNVSISEENKLGTEYVECFDFYKRQGLMSDELMLALDRYDQLLDEKQVEWLKIKLDKSKNDQLLSEKETQLVKAQERYKVENSILSTYIKESENISDEKQKEQAQLVAQIEREIQTLLQEINGTDGLKEKSKKYQQQMAQIGIDIQKENATDSQGKIFTELDLEELSEYIVEGSIENEYYLTSYGLYQHGLEKIKDMNDVAIDFSIEVSNFMQTLIHPNGWQEVVGIGERIWIDDLDIRDERGFIQLTGFVFNPNKFEISQLKFTNNKEPKSDIKTIGDIARKTATTSHMTNYWKDVWKDAQTNNVHVSELLKNGLDAAAMAVRARNTVNKIDITEAGIFIQDAQETDKQVALMSGLIALTEDGWQTSKIAISAEGVVAETIVGRLLLGDKLIIGNEENTFTINPDGLSVFDPNAVEEERIFLGIRDGKAQLRLHSSKGDKRLVLSEEGIYNIIPIHAMDNFDKDNALECAFYMGNNIQSIHEFSLRIKLDRFRAYSKTSKSGGGVSTTKTSKSSGSFSVSSSTNMGGYKKQTSGTMISVGETVLTQPPKSEYQNFNEPSYKQHIHEILPTQFEHKHEFVIPDHDHDFTVSQGGHTHTVELEIDPHTHDMSYGIYENSASPTVDIYLDSTLIASNVTSSKTYDITTQAAKLTTGWHSIKVVGVSKTGNTEGLGRASIDASIGAFVSF